MTNIDKYWKDFYTSSDISVRNNIPSQFSTLILNELSEVPSIIEIACGNGKDAEFFALYGKNVLAIDVCEEAIKLCKVRNTKNNLEFEHHASLYDMSSSINKYLTINPLSILYARFFLHAITDEDEKIFLNLAKDLLSKGSFIALEYRTIGDQTINKIHSPHYRRYIDHAEICTKLEQHGFKILYEIEGVGMAKYKNEDALVGRCIAIKII